METPGQELGFASCENARAEQSAQWMFEQCDITATGREIAMPLNSDELAMGYRTIGTAESGLPDGVEALALSRNPQNTWMLPQRYIVREISRTLRRTGLPPNWLNIDIAVPVEPGSGTVALAGIEWLGISLLAFSNKYLMHFDESSAAHLTVESTMSGVHGPSDSIGPPRTWRCHR